MNKQVKKYWVEALRSGKYKQSDAQLRKGDKFCCLGVLCDLHRKHTKGNKWDLKRTDPMYDNEVGYPPKSVREWAGLNARDPQIHGRKLSNRNDEGQSFEKIADLIENNL